MTARTIYSTGGGMDGYPGSNAGHVLNSSGCSIAIQRVRSGNYLVGTIGRDGLGNNSARAVATCDRAELRLIYEALGRELADG